MSVDKEMINSKTFWFGILTAAAPAVPVIHEVITTYPEASMAVVGFIVIALRRVTKSGVKFFGR